MCCILDGRGKAAETMRVEGHVRQTPIQLTSLDALGGPCICSAVPLDPQMGLIVLTYLLQSSCNDV